MSSIRVEVSPLPIAIDAQWEALAGRACPNVFMHPAALNAAQASGLADLRVLLAWDHASDPQTLVGIWALQARKLTPFGPAVLDPLPHDYAFGSQPVFEEARAAEVMAAFLAALADHPGPKVLRLRNFDGEGPAFAALRDTPAARVQLSVSERPVVSREAGMKLSGSTRKKLRQDWNRLGSLGAVDIQNERAPAAVLAALEVFLALELKSWKGDRGTALLSRPSHAAFARGMVADMATRGHASVALLRLDGRPIAAQVLLYCGRTAYTWKTAFDTDFAKHSPGTLLVDKVVEQLFAGTEIDAIDSCSAADGFMAQLWSGRRSMVNLLLDLSGRKSLAFPIAAWREHSYQRLRGVRNRLRTAFSALGKKRALPRPKQPATQS
jgi:CelD/BcsL family acetyltransferase involved in cellulose biosynthesis